MNATTTKEQQKIAEHRLIVIKQAPKDRPFSLVDLLHTETQSGFKLQAYMYNGSTRKFGALMTKTNTNI